MKAPCLNCKDRDMHCHSNCNKYKDFRNKIDTIKNNKAEFEFKDYLCDAIHRMQTVRR